MTLYQKYRPKDFDDLIGQQFVRQALTGALQRGKTVSTYLFCGSRGTGKTSVARILAKASNCLHLRSDGNPCGECQNCVAFAEGTMLDVVEIDGASNNGVANVRELIERARFQPSQGKYKIYIIDEVHMLSSGAFNALLKTLEEPPEHVKFILATTEFHKIPETIVSRAQRYDFRKISDDDIVEHLRRIAQKEEIVPEEDALVLIARLARWGLRDALSLFEQYSVWGVLSYDFIRENLSIIDKDSMKRLTDSILQGDGEVLAKQLSELRLQSIEPKRFLEQYLYFLRELAFERMGEPIALSQVFRLFDACTTAYTRIKEFPNGFMLLELTLLGQLIPEGIGERKTGWESEKKLSQKTERSAALWAEKPVEPARVEKSSALEEREGISSNRDSSPKASSPASMDTPSEPSNPKASSPKRDFSFTDLVSHVRSTPKKWVLLTALKTGTFNLDPESRVFTLSVPTEFVRNQLDTADTRSFLADSFVELFGMSVEIQFASGAKSKWSIPSAAPLNPADVSDIF